MCQSNTVEQNLPWDWATPVGYCVQQFGGVTAFANAIGRTRRQVYKWRNQGGLISSQAQTDTILAAKRLGVEVDPLKLVFIPPNLSKNARIGVKEGTSDAPVGVKHAGEPT